ncbi:MAG: hypothetical protein K0S21_341 [Rhizobiaceae bacterium]|jgi:hypothetical protein|nr:hypothetical protein [Rhizobiaceae bacterium]
MVLAHEARIGRLQQKKAGLAAGFGVRDDGHLGGGGEPVISD